MTEATKYRMEFDIIPQSDGWGTTVDSENYHIFNKDGSSPNKNGYTMEDLGEDEWDKIEKAAHRFFNPHGGVNWGAWEHGTDYTIITAK